jgi:predicted GNAT family acetyltransferase
LAPIGEADRVAAWRAGGERVLRTTAVRPLDGRDLPAALELVARDPVENVFVGSRLGSGWDPWRLGAELWGHFVDGELTSFCYVGANLVPVQADAEAVEAYADRARRSGRRCSSIVGPARAVAPLWQRLEPDWGPARDVRRNQPVCVIREPSPVPADPAVRLVRSNEIERFLPAAVAMFTEEVGVSPLGSDGGALYRARVTETVHAGRALARFENGRVVFKAELGAVTEDVCQVQGVWVAPERRGEGLSVSGMAAVVDHALRHVAPAVTLYVNDYNAAARAAYHRVGFRQVGTFMSVLF